MNDKCLRLLPVIAVVGLFFCSGCGRIEGPDFPYAASPRAIVHTPASPASGSITVTFQLIDLEAEQGTVVLEYSTDNGQTFSSCALVDPAEATGLESALYPGITHSVQWNSVADGLALSGNATVRVKVTPSDASNPSGTPGVSGAFTVNNTAYNQPPGASVATPAGVQFGNIPINYFLSDVESDTCSVAVEFSTDDGANWSTATMGPAGEGVTGLSSSPSGTPHTFLWNSRADNVAPSGQVDTVKFKITPTDFHEGTAGETNAFSVDNTIANDPPTVTITGGPADGSTVSTNQVTFTWSGSDTDGSVVGYYYSFDHDPPDVWTTDTSVTSGVLSEGPHIFRLVAVDDQYDLSAVALRTFTVIIPGTITANFSASPTTGAAPLTVSFTDLSSATNGIDTWSWTFGDGGTSTAQNPNYEYSSAGTYTVALTVTGPDGSDTQTKTDYITVTGPSGDIIYVDGTDGFDTNDGLSWGNAVKTIQTGIDKAGVGWTVLVADGTYVGTRNKNLDFSGMAMHLKSAGGAANCIIDCQNDWRGFQFHMGEATDTIVDGFTIINGNMPDDTGGAILCLNASSPTITNCVMRDCNATIGSGSAGGGGAIRLNENCNAVITNCTMINNHGGDWGGAIYVDDASPLISNCVITTNTSDFGGGIYFRLNGNPTIENCVIAGNTAADQGGAVYSYQSPTFTMNNCTIDNNHADGFGGGFSLDDSSPAITGCTITNNSADQSGGGIMCYGGAGPTVTDCFISGNSAVFNGGGIGCEDCNPVTIINCAIIGNTADWGGAVEVLNNCNVTIKNCTLANNTATEYGGGILCFHEDTSYNDVQVDNSILWSNTAAASGHQIFIWPVGSTITLNYCDYADNSLDPKNVEGIGTVTEQGVCIHLNPLFVAGPRGDYYLSQLAAGQGANSPCLDAGSTTAASLGLDTKTTRTDAATDSGIVDIGYHYDP